MPRLLSAAAIYALVPLGAVVSYANGEPRPPERFVKKLRAWENQNGSGVLVEKNPSVAYSSGYVGTPGFVLNTGNYGAGAVRVLVVNTIFDLNSTRAFSVPDETALSVDFPHLVKSEHRATWKASERFELVSPYPGSNDSLVVIRTADGAAVEFPGTHGTALREASAGAVNDPYLERVFAERHPVTLEAFATEAGAHDEATGRAPTAPGLLRLAYAHGLTPVQARTVDIELNR